MNITETLNQRGKNYGNFNQLAFINRKLDNVIDEHGTHLDATQRKALEMILHKVSRILNGNAHYADNWVDIAGYAHLGGRLYEEETTAETVDNLTGEIA
ncbi:hypothetical protein A4G19_15800 [Pasteurellaceae bacterium Macca]|nr:hypothetical protein [Pasteurellaceae bacterium Macca]MCK3656086.1 hypothetical protein [Pasteurellaceae bacterium Macca]MCK3656188.1 hypothetical protein [Pasteurellaceae bacterium Macca]MCK3656406.1 hypothetical protein [Pasteurellaceae bacterium Macca]MCK3656500.1 hypothetical protein [Pasteurellaceae bacterium Macca]